MSNDMKNDISSNYIYFFKINLVLVKSYFLEICFHLNVSYYLLHAESEIFSSVNFYESQEIFLKICKFVMKDKFLVSSEFISQKLIS